MKNFLFICFAVILNFTLHAQNELNKSVDFKYKNISLKDFFKDVEKKYDVHFSYSNIHLSKKISVNYKGKLKDALDISFKFTSLSYSLIDKHIVIKKKSIGVLKTNIKGRVIDGISKEPILGVSIIIKDYEPFTGTTTNLQGDFVLTNLPLGRYTFRVQAVAYESQEIKEILLTTGKEKYLEIALNEKINEVNEIIVNAKIDKSEAINQMALTSSRTFSVEETQRYAMSVSDPARMAHNYAGVTNSGDDSSNDLVIRGNSPRGLLWRLEGIEIPNPNHFGNMGAKGGLISVLSSSVLSNSDFYTSTFPTEFGNAISGVFDLKFRKGNNQKREHSLSLSLLGVEGSTEGFFSRNSKASYIFKYRFSTINFLRPIKVDLENASLSFQDLSFKINVPTKQMGSFSVFALGADNNQINKAKIDSSQWIIKDDRIDFNEKQSMAVLGIANNISLTKNTHLKSIVATTFKYQRTTEDILDTIPDFKILRVNDADFKNLNVLASLTLTSRLKAGHVIQSGIVYEFKNYDFFLNLNESDSAFIFFNSKGNTHFIQSFINWKFRVSSKVNINSGIHFSYLHLNKTYAIDPRIGIKYKLNKKHNLAFSTGLYSRPEHISTYLLENRLGLSFKSNLNLQMNKSLQTVLSYTYKFAKDYHLKTEVYYQYLFDIPVSTDENSNYSTLNSENVFDIILNNLSNGGELVSLGQGQNYGIDLSLEKYFSKRYYAMLSASLFDSKYKTVTGKQYHTKFANHFLINLVAGKEFVVGKHKNNLINLNGKFVFNGGKRYTPINIAKSKETQIEFKDEDAIYTKQFNPYYRLDIGFNYKINTKSTTHTFSLDIQNVTNHRNDYDVYYNFKTNEVLHSKQLGFIPFLKYKIDFSFQKKLKP